MDEVLRSPGKPLDPDVRVDMERRFAHDFSRVRIHADPQAARSARAVDAFAYTIGQNVVVDAEWYRPFVPTGRRLLVHELTHVLRQEQAPVSSRRLQRWDRSHHEELTRGGVEKTMKGFSELRIDPEALELLVRASGAMDFKIGELWFNIGGWFLGWFGRFWGWLTGAPGTRHEWLTGHYKRNRERALNHGEGGLYELSKDEAAAANHEHQILYETTAYRIFKGIPDVFPSIRESEWTKSAGRNGVFSLLGDALHVAQDRGAHGEGAIGLGHDNPEHDPDSPAENVIGDLEARRNTELVLLRAIDILYKMLSIDYMHSHTIRGVPEVRYLRSGLR